MYFMRAVSVDIGVAWHSQIVWFDTDLANALSSYMAPEGDTSSDFKKQLWLYSLYCNVFEEISCTVSAIQRARCKEPSLDREP